ncbi:serine hydrolase [Fodinicola feengrottensis]|uniref:serine hydrolase n=1 Tax=Fodinicola feengrottensis TaxID=435914 RepID=UPI002442A2D7|nr:serine hydrolase [Fodinicola feengrottensis]
MTVVELATDGRPLSTADVLLSPRYPDGKVVPVDTNLATDQVRWRYWDDSEWDRQNGQGSRDVLPGLEKAPIDYMSPYPASILKLMVGYGILRLVDRGQLSLDQTYSYEPTLPDGFCGGSVSRKVRQFFDDMITVSSDASTCALIQVLRDHGGIDALNNQFTQLGMPTLKLVGGGSPARTWARWTPRSCCCSFPAGPAHYGPRQAEEPSRPRS